MKPNKKSVTKFGGTLDISDDLKINVVSYTKTTKSDLKIMRLQEHSKVAKPSVNSNDGKIKKDSIKYVHDDPNMEEVDKEF